MAEPDHPRWRQGYDAVESTLGPRLEKLVGTDEFAQGVGAVLALRRQVEEQVTRTSRRVLHQLNLPAGTDVTRLLAEIGDLRKQLREMANDIEDLKAAIDPDGGARRGRPRR